MSAAVRRSLMVLGVLLVAVGMDASPATARQLVTHSLTSSFDGALSTAGPFGERIASVAADEVSGDVYVLTNQYVVDKFDASGNPVPFSDPSLEGASSLTVEPESEAYAPNLRIFVDNSHTATQGRIYVVFGSFANIVWAFGKSGAPVGGNYPLKISGLRNLSVDPNTGNFWAGVSSNGFTSEWTSAGTATGREVPIYSRTQLGGGGESTAVDSESYVYLGHNPGAYAGEPHGVDKYTEGGIFQYNLLIGRLQEFPEIKIDPVTNDLYALTSEQISQFDNTGSRIAQFGGPFSDAIGLAVNGANGDVYVARSSAGRVDVYTPGATVTVPEVSSGSASDFNAPEVKVHAQVDPAGATTTECKFEWSSDTSFSNSTPCVEGPLSGSSQQAVSASITGLKKGETYNYRVAAGNGSGTVSGLVKSFVASDEPVVAEGWATNAHSDGAQLHSQITPEGAPTQFYFEYGLGDCAVSACEQTVPKEMGSALTASSIEDVVTGLLAESTYHYRVVATNQSGTTFGSDHTFTTFPFTAVLKDPCPNAHVRQQVGAVLLPDCRAYELVSAPDTGGYDVESPLVPNREPFGGYPDAQGRALYGIHDGAIPGPWNPTNRGVDPYLAIRGPDGWRTEYVGIPADNPFASAPFSSTLGEANASLTNFAFSGKGVCSPCFEDGSTGLPLREADGTLVQGMKGSVDPGSNFAEDGFVRKRFSADGTHVVFASTSKFAEGGNSHTGDVSIYDRDLQTGLTQVVSTDPTGHPLACLQGSGQCHAPGDGAGLAEIDISSDGSRIVVGQLVGTDSKGNRYYHLYMHVGNSPDTVDLTPDTTSGVLFDGMTSDGSMVYFTTKDALPTASDQDTDNSTDIYRADVGPTSATLTRVSTGAGGTGNTDSCNPAGSPTSWNATAGEGKCNVVAMAGGAGVASKAGGIYFFSPERLDTSSPSNQPVQNQANLYLADPGSSPRFVATIDTSDGKPGPPPPNHPVANPALVSGFEEATGLAVDQSTGDLYVVDSETLTLSRYTSAGDPDEFSTRGSNALPVEYNSRLVAVDNAPSSPFQGDFYAEPEFGSISVYSASGAQLGYVDEGEFAVCGVAVDPSTGAVYLSTRFGNTVWKFAPTSGTPPVSPANYVKTGITTSGLPHPCSIAADGEGHVYVSGKAGETVRKFNVSDFTSGSPAVEGTQIDPNSGNAIYVNSKANLLYVDEGEQIAVFDSSGNLVQRFGSGSIGSSSRGLAVNTTTQHVYAATGPHVVEFGYEPVPYVPIDNPAVRHGVDQAEVHHYGDFQVTENGRYAAFTSLLRLTGYDSNHLYEVFRYDATTGTLDCASCNPTNARPEGASELPANGLGLSVDGHVFFNSNDAIAPRDLDQRSDAYEWEGSSPKLISTGNSPFGSSLLGISRAGTDAFFFTYDTLVPEDRNGSLVKLYDARVEGGFPYSPPEPLCKASDECHGAGSAGPGPLPIKTITGEKGNHESGGARPCHPGFKRRHGHCVKQHHHIHSKNAKKHSRKHHQVRRHG